MSEIGTSAYDKFILESAEQYLQTVVLIDDKIFDIKSGDDASPVEKPPGMGRKPAKKKTTSSEKGDNDEKEDAHIVPDEVSFNAVQHSFANKRILCSLYQPQKSESYEADSPIINLCSAADVVIVDWDLDDALGNKATMLVSNLVQQSHADAPQQLRLILIYTTEKDLNSVANQIKNKIEEFSSEGSVESDRLVLMIDNVRIIVLGKNKNPHILGFEDFLVSEKDLANRTIKEFSQLASGLLQGVVLRGIAKLRENNRRILTSFDKDLDIAFLTHRALTMPDEACGHVIPLLTDEMRAVLEDTLGEYPFGKHPAINEIIEDWCEKYRNGAEEVALKNNHKIDGKVFAKSVFCKGPTSEYIKLEGSKPLTKDNVWTISNISHLSKLVTSLAFDDSNNKRFASLMSQRTKYSITDRSLRLGVIVKYKIKVDDEEKDRYLFCLQPVCDSVRMNGDRSFVFIKLDEAENGSRITHCVSDSNNNIISLLFKPKVSNIVMLTFSATQDRVNAVQKDSKFFFTDKNKKKYEWIAELKTEHAQRAAEQLGRELSRVGLTESEWLRINAK